MRRILWFLLAYSLIVLCAPLAAAAPENPSAGDATGIVVAGVPAPPGTPDELRAWMTEALRSKLNAPVTLTDGARSVRRTRRELGIGLDRDRMLRGVAARQNYVPLALTADLGAMKDALTRVGKAFEQPAVGAKPYLYQGQFRIKEGASGRNLNVPTTAERLSQAVENDPATTRFTVAIDKTPPPLTAKQLQGITGRLTSYATVAARNPSRNQNIEIAVEAIDGTLLSPGETFSLNQTVGRRTRARGFEEATVFVDAEKVQGVGGGVSQVTGTLFNAAALAGLKINEVNPHSRPVDYIPVGRDATVAWGSKDLKFTNNTGGPVYIQYDFDGRRLRATGWGKKQDGRQVTLTPRVQRRGPGHITAQLYRTVRENGKVMRKELLFGHAYRWEPTS
ncbi:MAG: Vancomycin B-type resistance protein VanW [uncultured Thermomicrobiales bacterium]|uniref:Vancomycin B-type resistance protein VanW n=1 Tax=uncultured Thermomicrobiales bacterium TaxID=1645740 RepID=A0A6J4VSV4_9BACT|nr:MAG: Vancomycin B-type resistance protein VanW [uncultured Thermomicrobiales bacterium]